MYLSRCKVLIVDGVQLYRLGKRLVELSRQVTTDAAPSRLTPAEVTVLEHVLRRPNASVRDLQTATSLAQSHVSTTVARLRDRRLVETSSNPDDRRTTLVRLTPKARAAIRRRAGTDATTALRTATGTAAAARRAAALLDELAELLELR
jgi:DNA-binding MarR family transcriptional regulator